MAVDPALDAAAASQPTDPVELLLWTLMREFEQLALERYRLHAPALATAEKERFVAALAALDLDRTSLASTELAKPVEALLSHARTTGELAALIVQGLVLEQLAQSIYGIAQGSDRASAGSRSLAAAGLASSRTVTAATSARLADLVGTGDRLYAVFAEVSHDVLGALDALAEPVDHIFGEHFGLRFADVMGEFVADLIGTCTKLGMQRRKVVAQLAGATMGL